MDRHSLVVCRQCTFHFVIQRNCHDEVHDCLGDRIPEDVQPTRNMAAHVSIIPIKLAWLDSPPRQSKLRQNGEDGNLEGSPIADIEMRVAE